MRTDDSSTDEKRIAVICDCGSHLQQNAEGRFACGCGTSYAVTVTRITKPHSQTS